MWNAYSDHLKTAAEKTGTSLPIQIDVIEAVTTQVIKDILSTMEHERQYGWYEDDLIYWAKERGIPVGDINNDT